MIKTLTLTIKLPQYINTVAIGFMDWFYLSFERLLGSAFTHCVPCSPEMSINSSYRRIGAVCNNAYH